MEKRVKLKENGKIIEFPFSILSEEAGELSTFKLKKKRAYINISSLIESTINDVLALDEDDTILFDYCQLKYLITMNDKYEQEDFIDDLYDILISDTMIDIIDKYVESRYQSFLVDKEVKKDSTQSLQFTDFHCKILLKISMIQKTIIPIILDYALKFDLKEIDSFLESCYDNLFKIFEQDNLIINKLYQTVDSKVSITKYSDQVLWNFVLNYGIDISTFEANVLSKLIVEAIPKYEFERNIISLNHVIINNTREHFFRLNFPIKFKESTGEEEDIDQFDKLEMLNAKIDESKNFYYSVILDSTIKKYKGKMKKLNMLDKLKDYHGIKINSVQKNLLFLYFGKDVNVCEILYDCNYSQYLFLLMVMVTELEEDEFTILPRILTANIENKKDKKIINKKQLMKLMESDRLNEIIESNYSAIKNLETSCIMNLFSSLLNPIFIDRNKGEVIEYNQDILCSEIIRFIEKVVS